MYPEGYPNPAGSLEPLEARLRAFPPPAVPADLLGRLTAIPDMLVSRRRHRRMWVGAIGALTAACLLAWLAWARLGGEPPVSNSSSRPDGSLEARRAHDEGEVPRFAWPLDNALTSTITADLLR
jgi:hypothetical protein